MTPAQVRPTISPELLTQIDVRVGTIESVSDVANSEKLVALHVTFGDHKRTILAGMKRERAKTLAKSKASRPYLLWILRQKKMAGMVSEGMLLDIGYLDGIYPGAGGAGIESA